MSGLARDPVEILAVVSKSMAVKSRKQGNLYFELDSSVPRLIPRRQSSQTNAIVETLRAI